MVTGCGKALFLEKVTDLLYFLSGGAVDNAALVAPLCHQAAQRFRLAFGSEHLEVEVGPVKACDHRQGILQPQQPDYVLLHLPGGCGSKGGNHRTVRKLPEKIHDLQIAGAEILSPLGYAMGLIHRQHGNPDSRHRPAKSFRLQPLRGHIDDFIHPRSHIPVNQANLGRGQGAVDIGPSHSHAFQRHHLILHQGNEGGYHQGNALHHKRGNLIAQALSAPCGHDAEHIPPGQLGPNQVFLALPEGFVAKVFTEKFLYFIHFLPIFFPEQDIHFTSYHMDSPKSNGSFPGNLPEKEPFGSGIRIRQSGSGHRLPDLR